MILIIDNYDSFTYNLYQYIGEIHSLVSVVRNDEISIEAIEKMKPDGIVLSPGPGKPENTGICVEVIRKLHNKVPILGICIGLQAIGYAFGGDIVEAKRILHGKTAQIKHNDPKLFKEVKADLKVMRYHSLVVKEATLPKELVVTAKSLEDDEIMALKHKSSDLYGVQFHPESLFTEQGKDIIKNFLMEVCHVSGCN